MPDRARTLTVRYMENTHHTNPNTTVIRGRSYYTARDSKGRFVKVESLNACRFGGGFHNDEAGVSHSHSGCGEVTGTTTHSTTQEWACSACITVERSTIFAEFAPDSDANGGTQKCDTCNTTQRTTKFPTEFQCGFKFRGSTCRGCGGGGHRVAA